ncbi:hypothetical protein KUTeg_001538 [Tegillarca granosa]|uniref:UBX domain-containing protein n=1 Tax=Tegillarca granosa TaxID=220873 RepID=A0ABQ9FT86_TEGGR|nr:hypothetical protein KUTeg_001538 [Tegillarca granosa]
MQSSGMIDVELERPKTSKGRRNRPTSRLGRRPIHDKTDDLEGDFGRPASRRGFTPETYERHDYDEFSRQVPDSPSPQDFYGSPPYTTDPHPHPTGIQYSTSEPYENHDLSHYSPRNETLFINRPSSREHTGDMSPSFSMMHPEYDKTNYRSGSHRHSNHSNRRYSHESQDEGLPPSGYRHSKYSPQSDGRNSNMGMSPSRDQMTNKRDSLTVPFERPSSGYPMYDRQMSPKSEAKHYREFQLPPENAPQVSHRPKSSRKRPRSARRTAMKNPELQIEGQPADDPINTPVLRPQSSLSRYKPLPAIGTTIDPSKADEYIDQSLSPQTHVLKLDDDNDSGSHARVFNFENLETEIPEEEKNISPKPRYRRESECSDSFSGQHFENDSSVRNSGTHNEMEKEDMGFFKPETTFKPHFLPEEPSEDETRILLAVRLLNGQRHERYFRPTEQLDLVLQFAENMGMQDLSSYNLACNAPRLVFSDMTALIRDSGLVERTVLYLEQR